MGLYICFVLRDLEDVRQYSVVRYTVGIHHKVQYNVDDIALSGYMYRISILIPFCL